MTIRPLPWELDGNGRPKRRTLEDIARLAGRNWLATAGPRKACMSERLTSAIVGEARSTGGFTSLTKLTVNTNLRGRDGRNWLFSHRIEDRSGHAVTTIDSKLAVSGEAEWSVFPPYPVAVEAVVGQ
ncbi:MAG: hypothetical protein WDZ83_08210 [Rhizobiaceae bacterium]